MWQSLCFVQQSERDTTCNSQWGKHGLHPHRKCEPHLVGIGHHSGRVWGVWHPTLTTNNLGHLSPIPEDMAQPIWKRVVYGSAPCGPLECPWQALGYFWYNERDAMCSEWSGLWGIGSYLIRKLKSFLTNLGTARDVQDPIEYSEVGGTSPPVQQGPLRYLCRLVRCNLG